MRRKPRIANRNRNLVHGLPRTFSISVNSKIVGKRKMISKSQLQSLHLILIAYLMELRNQDLWCSISSRLLLRYSSGLSCIVFITSTAKIYCHLKEERGNNHSVIGSLNYLEGVPTLFIEALSRPIEMLQERTMSAEVILFSRTSFKRGRNRKSKKSETERWLYRCKIKLLTKKIAMTMMKRRRILLDNL